MDYGKTLHLPETEFPMRGNLPKREPDFLKFGRNMLFMKNVCKREKERLSLFFMMDLRTLTVSCILVMP